MPNRKILLVVSCALALFILACSNESFRPSSSYDDYGLIKGLDLALCACCGGYIIEIDEVVYKVDSIQEPYDMKLVGATFPLAVNLNWRLNAASACPERIVVDALEIVR